MTATPARRLLRAPAFLGLLGTNFVLGLTSAFILPFGSLWATQEIGMSPQLLGLFMTINTLSAIAVSTLVGRWSDSHLPRRGLLVAGALAGALGYAGYASVSEPLWLTLIGSSALALASLNFPQLFAHVREELARSQAQDISFLMGVLRASYALAWMVGPNLGAAIKTRFGFRGLLLATSAFCVLLALFVLRFVAHRARPPRGGDPGGAAGGPAPAGAPRAAGAEPAGGAGAGLRAPVVLAHAGAFALLFAAFTLNTLNMPLFLTQQLGGSDRTVGAAFAVSPLFEMLFMLWFGHIAARGQQRRVIVAGACAAVVYFLGLRAVNAPWQIYPLQILNAAAVAVVTSVAIPFFQDLLPGQAGSATSLYSNALKAGSLLGFSTFGLLASRVGNTGLFAVCAALAAATLALLVFARPRRPARARSREAPG